jgi:hypothetical protein
VHFVGLHYIKDVHINYQYVEKWKTGGSLSDSLHNTFIEEEWTLAQELLEHLKQ